MLGDKLIGFQAKYYSDSVSMSGKENELSVQLKEQQELILVLQHFIFILVKNFLQVPKKIL